jgi:hypothetical protein
MAFQPKGTGAIDLAAGSSGVNVSNGGTVTAVTRTAAGSGYTSFPSVTITAPTTTGGVQATATCTLYSVSAPAINSGGTGYTVNDVLTLSGGTFTSASTFTVTTVSSGVITGLSLTTTGNYTARPTTPASVTGGTGTGATVTPVGGVNGFTITNAGSGYIEQPTVSFSGGSGSGAAAYATVGSGVSLKTLGGTLTFNGSSGDVFRIYDYGGQSGIGVRGHILSGTAPAIFPTPSNSGQTNITLQLASLGTGSINFSTGGSLSASGVFNQIDQLRVAHTVSAVNYVQVTGAATTSLPIISAQGSDTNVGIWLTAKGTSGIRFGSNSTANLQFRIVGTNAAVNNLVVTGTTAGIAPILFAEGSDTDVSMALQSKGAGAIDLAAGSSGINISNGTTVTAVIRTAAGTGFTTPPTWTAAAPTTAGGVTASGSVNSIGVVTATVSAGGSGYVVGDVLTVSGGTQTTAATLTVATLSGSAVATVTISNAGVYTASPTNPAATTGGTGTGATFTLSFGINNSFTVSTAGSGYVEQPAITFSGGGGSGATANGLIGSTSTVRFLSDATFYTASGPVLNLLDVSNQGSNAYLQLNNGASSSVQFKALGGNTNIGYFYISKGNGSHQFTTQSLTSVIQFAITNTTSAVNYVSVTGATTGNDPVISVQGSDTDRNLRLSPKGTGQVFSTSAFVAASLSFNSLRISGGASTGLAPVIASQGTDTNIDLTLTPKGTGSVVATAPVKLQGYTVATLPTAGTVGRTAYVTDATAPTYLGTLTGGGAVKTPVFDNGTAWVSY